MKKPTAAVSEARQITSSLRRVRENMAAGVMHADEAVSTLLQDGDTIKDTLDEHKVHLKGSLQVTKQKLNRVKSAEEREKYSVFLSLAFFTAVVAYIILKRTRILSLLIFSIRGAFYGGGILHAQFRSPLVANITSTVGLKTQAEQFRDIPLPANKEVTNGHCRESDRDRFGNCRPEKLILSQTADDVNHNRPILGNIEHSGIQDVREITEILTEKAVEFDGGSVFEGEVEENEVKDEVVGEAKVQEPSKMTANEFANNQQNENSEANSIIFNSAAVDTKGSDHSSIDTIGEGEGHPIRGNEIGEEGMLLSREQEEIVTRNSHTSENLRQPLAGGIVEDGLELLLGLEGTAEGIVGLEDVNEAAPLSDVIIVTTDTTMGDINADADADADANANANADAIDKASADVGASTNDGAHATPLNINRVDIMDTTIADVGTSADVNSDVDAHASISTTSDTGAEADIHLNTDADVYSTTGINANADAGTYTDMNFPSEIGADADADAKADASTRTGVHSNDETATGSDVGADILTTDATNDGDASTTLFAHTEASASANTKADSESVTREFNTNEIMASSVFSTVVHDEEVPIDEEQKSTEKSQEAFLDNIEVERKIDLTVDVIGSEEKEGVEDNEVHSEEVIDVEAQENADLTALQAVENVEQGRGGADAESKAESTTSSVEVEVEVEVEAAIGAEAEVEAEARRSEAVGDIAHAGDELDKMSQRRSGDDEL